MPGGMATIGYDDDGVKTMEFPIIRDGILVGLQTNRETAPQIGDKRARGAPRRPLARLRSSGCRTCGSRPARKARPTSPDHRRHQGRLIDGRGSYSIDQRRYERPVRRQLQEIRTGRSRGW
jgi:TldD protein